jgi:hypothetical protein
MAAEQSIPATSLSNIPHDHVAYPAEIAGESYRECPVIDCGVHSQPVSGVLAN